jgi:hypothetical protein
MACDLPRACFASSACEPTPAGGPGAFHRFTHSMKSVKSVKSASFFVSSFHHFSEFHEIRADFMKFSHFGHGETMKQ